MKEKKGKKSCFLFIVSRSDRWYQNWSWVTQKSRADDAWLIRTLIRKNESLLWRELREFFSVAQHAALRMRHKLFRTLLSFAHNATFSPSYSLSLTNSAQFNLVHNSIFPSTVSVLCRLFWPQARVTLSLPHLTETRRLFFRCAFYETLSH